MHPQIDAKASMVAEAHVTARCRHAPRLRECRAELEGDAMAVDGCTKGSGRRKYDTLPKGGSRLLARLRAHAGGRSGLSPK